MLKYILIPALLLTAASACMTKFEEYNTNPNEMEQWKISPCGHAPGTALFGGPVFLYRTWQLNGELIQYTIAGSGNNTYHRYVIEEFGGCVGLEQSLHAGGQCRPHAPIGCPERRPQLRGYCTHVADAVPAEHCRPVRRRPYSQAFKVRPRVSNSRCSTRRRRSTGRCLPTWSMPIRFTTVR